MGSGITSYWVDEVINDMYKQNGQRALFPEPYDWTQVFVESKPYTVSRDWSAFYTSTTSCDAIKYWTTTSDTT